MDFVSENHTDGYNYFQGQAIEDAINTEIDRENETSQEFRKNFEQEMEN